MPVERPMVEQAIEVLFIDPYYLYFTVACLWENLHSSPATAQFLLKTVIGEMLYWKFPKNP